MTRARDLAAFVSNADGDIKFDTDTLFIDSSANRVGIGTTTPARALHVSTSQNNVAKFKSTDAEASILLEDSNSTADYNRIGVTTHNMHFVTNNNEAMRINDSQHVVFGKTTADNTTAGTTIYNGLGMSSVRNGALVAIFNRLTDDGTIIDLRKDSVSNGVLGAIGGGMFIGDGDVGLEMDGANNAIYPINTTTLANTDNHTDLGDSDKRFKDLYLGGGAYIGGTGSANHLQDYEKGTWTPVFAGSTAGTYTYGEQQGHYIKVGDQVTAWFNLTNITTSSAGSGLARIEGLPFAANWVSGFNGEAVGSVSVNGFTGISGLDMFVIIQDASSKILLYHHTSDSTQSVDTIDAQDKNSNSADIRGFVTYYVGG